jgi:hypothetical protein
MVKIGDEFFISTVYVTRRPKTYESPRNGFLRDEGEGEGFICRFNRQGELLSRLSVGEGSIYHPGGIDFDGQYIWVPPAEYRPDSKSFICRVDPFNMTAEKVFGVADHIGGVVHAWDENCIIGISWSARRFYRWPLNKDGCVIDPDKNRIISLNHSDYIAYQDCIYLGRGEMLCSGWGNYKNGDVSSTIGGIEIVDINTWLPIHQVAVKHWSPVTGRPMTFNPFWMEMENFVLTAYFIPDDENSVMYVYKIGIDMPFRVFEG